MQRRLLLPICNSDLQAGHCDREHGAGGMEHGAGGREPGAGGREQGAGGSDTPVIGADTEPLIDIWRVAPFDKLREHRLFHVTFAHL